MPSFLLPGDNILRRLANRYASVDGIVQLHRYPSVRPSPNENTLDQNCTPQSNGTKHVESSPGIRHEFDINRFTILS